MDEKRSLIFGKMAKAIYVPALGGSLNNVSKTKRMYKNKELNVFGPNSFYEYNYALMSAFHGLSIKNFREALHISKDKLLIGDSGGYQIASFEKKGIPISISPIQILRWQEENCDIGMNLDVPTTLGGEVLTKERFINCLNKSVENFELFQSKRQSNHLKLYNVLHGENLELLNIWYDKVKHFKFEGWAIGMKPPSDPLIQALGFMFLYEKGELNNCYGIHFFGTSGYYVIPIISYLANMVKDNVLVTFDSSSYAQHAQNRVYIQPFNISEKLVFGDKFLKENPNIKELSCSCNVCKELDIKILNRKEEGSLPVALLALHNLKVYLDYTQMCNSLVKEPSKFLTLKFINKRIKVTMEFIEFAKQYGVEKAYKRFEHEFKHQGTVETSKQLNVFSYSK